MKTRNTAPTDAAPAENRADGLFPAWCFGGLLAESRPVWRQQRRWIGPGTAILFLAIVFLSRFDPAWMDLSLVGEHPALDQLAKNLSRWGEFHMVPLISLGVVALGGWAFKQRAAIYAACSGFLGGASAGLIVMIVKVIFGRPRPDQHVADGFYWFKFGSGWASFPSGHTAHCFGMAVGVSMVLPWTWPFTMLAAAAVAWSRFQLDRHYPTDILMGMWLGVAAGVVFGLAARRCLDRHWPQSAEPKPSSAPSPQ